MGFWAVLEALMVFIFQPPLFAGLSGYCAEMSSAMLGGERGLPVAHFDPHASYLDHGLTMPRDDDRDPVCRSEG
jgi:hypothetical protein